jgi:hypothetical protein
VRIAGVIARYFLGIMFTVFGLNGFLQFIHQPPPTNPVALQFFTAIAASHFSAFFCRAANCRTAAAFRILRTSSTRYVGCRDL